MLGRGGKIVSLEAGKQFGRVRWEAPNLGKPPGTTLPLERVALEGRFRYVVEDETELLPMALRSGLGAVASLHGQPLLRDSKAILRAGLPTHVVP